MKKYMVIGDPVSHSRSPGMQNAAFELAGLGRPYSKQRVTPEELPEFFAFARQNLAGVNLTVPHKQQAFQLADELTSRAEICGSVNTLLISGGRILGDSTDGIGLEEALKYCFGEDLAGKRILFCGAGGAARATAVHLAGCGCREISFINRTLNKAQELSELCISQSPQLQSFCAVPDDETQVAGLLARADYLIQATSVGLKPDDPPVLAEKFFNEGMKLRIFDTIYHPTALQKIAGKYHIPCANGKEMLVRQGAASFEQWTGIKPDLEAMRRGFEEEIEK